MGVHELWDIVGPTARPVRLEALRSKRLAIDASIWIYQFLKAVRDKNGNPLKNAHIVGFFRRICKLLYFGIRPVFVFDGGVPALKKQTIRKRKERRQDQKENVEKTAQRLLAKQLQHRAEAENEGDRAIISHKQVFATKREVPIENLQFEEYYDDNNYLKSAHISQSGGQEPKKKERESKFFGKQDDYDLPRLEKFDIDKNDERMVTDYEYDRLTQNIKDGLGDVNLDNIDPESSQFDKLPLSTQYIILSHLRLRSRLRMGYTKDQLEALFPNSMEFSKFQIQMVQKRNYYTQRLMNASGMDKDSFDDISRRVAGEKNREYKLKRTEGGYVLSITKENEDEGRTVEKPIKISDENETEDDKESFQSEDEFLDNFEPDNNDSGNEIDSLDYWPDTDDSNKVGNEKKLDKKSPGSITYSENNDNKNDSDDDDDDDNDDDSVQWEDLSLDKKTSSFPIEMNKSGLPTISLRENKPQHHEAVTAFMDPSIHSDNTLFVEQSKNKERNTPDPIMDKIKSLYEYAERNNKNNATMTVPPIIQQDTESFPTDEDELHSMEEDELRQAIELSKKDYRSMQQKSNDKADSNIVTARDTDQPPIILTKEALSKTLKLPTFNTGGSLLQKGNVPQIHKKKKTHDNITAEKVSSDSNSPKGFAAKNAEVSSKPKNDSKIPAKLPDWFNNTEVNQTPEERFKSDIGVNNALNEKTEDEKAGIVKFSEVEDLLSAKDEVSDPLILDDANKPKEKAEVIYIRDSDEYDSPATQESPKESAVQVSGNAQVQKSRTAEQIPDDLVANPLSRSNGAKQGLEDSYEFSEEEEEILNQNLKKEEETYGQFVDTISQNVAPRQNSGSKWTMDEEIKLQEKLKKQKRDSDEVSTSMILDVQDLLSRFGIPFITAPMEAEAQCAELFGLKLVDGIVTDDSDCFLFGGSIIYKNMFNEKNFVECYQLEDIAMDMGLTRKQMIDLALMLGSDYTSGLKGVGKVTAVEILSEFGDLVTFRNWWLEYQGGKIDKSNDNKMRRKIRKQMSKADLFLGRDFPDPAVINAYLHPEVDHDKTKFQWGYPNLDKLRTFLMFNVGWTQDKIDQILIPIIKSMNKPQKIIEEFFPAELVRKRRKIMMGKRLTEATNKLKASYDERQAESKGQH